MLIGLKNKKRFAAVYGRTAESKEWYLMNIHSRTALISVLGEDFKDDQLAVDDLLDPKETYSPFSMFKVVMADEMYLFPYEEPVGENTSPEIEIRKECIYSRTFAFDLDGTMAHYSFWGSLDQIGPPIKPIIDKIKELRAKGERCVIFTARAQIPESKPFIEKWCLEHVGEILPIQNTKTLDIVQIFDDRAVSVEHNTGRCLDANEKTGVADAWK